MMLFIRSCGLSYPLVLLLEGLPLVYFIKAGLLARNSFRLFPGHVFILPSFF